MVTRVEAHWLSGSACAGVGVAIGSFVAVSVRGTVLAHGGVLLYIAVARRTLVVAAAAAGPYRGFARAHARLSVTVMRAAALGILPASYTLSAYAEPGDARFVTTTAHRTDQQERSTQCCDVVAVCIGGALGS